MIFQTPPSPSYSDQLLRDMFPQDLLIEEVKRPTPSLPTFGVSTEALPLDQQLARDVIKKNMASREWRLNNLYYTINEKGQKVRFRLRWAQKQLLKNMWFFNIILKARQLGFTTFICILFLDTCLFRPDTHCGIIAHNREDAEEFFSNKVKYAYDNLPEWLRKERHAPTDSAKKLAFSNGSSIRVGTSLRSGTFYMLHISEFGKICARFPAKAEEIVTGSLNTVHAGQFVFIESTAEGRDGPFYEFCTTAMKLMMRGIKLNPLQFRFHFFPWWKEPSYRLTQQMPIDTEKQTYFKELAEKGIHLSVEQKYWYVTKYTTQQENMMREFPSTPEEAFLASIVGAYFARQMTDLRRNRRIGRYPHDPLYPVNVFWDIGFNDNMSLWFHQRIGGENRLIHYFEGSNEGLQYYVDYLNKRPYIYANQYMPHDARNHSVQTGERFDDYARKLGLRRIIRVERARNPEEVLQGIQAARSFLGTVTIDEEECAQGIKCLDNYRKEWDPNLSEFKKTPLHNWASNGADALRCGAVGYKYVENFAHGDLLPEYAEDI